MKILKSITAIVVVIIFLIELSSLIFLKLKISKNFEHSNFIFLDLVSIMHDYNVQDIFIDSCCHLTSKGSRIIAKEINKIVLKY